MKVKRLPTEVDNEIELIDLSNLTSITPEEDAVLSALNYRVVPKHPVKWEINGFGGFRKIYEDGSIEFNEKGCGDYHEIYPKCNTLTRPKIKHTQIISLLTQNNSGLTRPANFCYRWDQTDEAFYRGKAKEGLAEFIAETRPNYFCVPYASKYRYLFKCPDLEKIIATISSARGGTAETEYDDTEYDESNVDYGCGHFELPLPNVQQGDILIHVDPKTGQATYVCPRCTYNNKKIFGGTGYPVKHSIDRDIRQKLSEAGIIPVKEYKNKDRTVEVDAIINLVDKNPRGIGYYKIDQAFAWPKGTAKRLVEKHLRDRVLVRVKDGKTKVCPLKNRYV